MTSYVLKATLGQYVSFTDPKSALVDSLQEASRFPSVDRALMALQEYMERRTLARNGQAVADGGPCRFIGTIVIARVEETQTRGTETVELLSLDAPPQAGDRFVIISKHVGFGNDEILVSLTAPINGHGHYAKYPNAARTRTNSFGTVDEAISAVSKAKFDATVPFVAIRRARFTGSKPQVKITETVLA